MTDLSVIVISWNTADDLRQCLLSLAQPQGCALQVLVADNASSDGSREMVRDHFPEVALIANERNLGFGAGNNRAIPHAVGRYVMFLNPDTIVVEGALGELARYADSRPDTGAFGPKMLHRDGRLQYSCRSFPNLGTGFFRNTPLGRLFPRNRFTEDYLLADWDHSTPRDVDWVSGSALMVRRELLERTGGFDEGFFMYCEDVDLCFRIHELGYQVTYYPGAVIYHIIGRSSDQVPTRMTYEFHRSMYRFYRKHYARDTPWLVRPLIIPGLIARASGRLVQYRWRNIRRRMGAGRAGG